MAFRLAHIFRTPPNTRRFETADTLGIVEGGGKGKREGRKCERGLKKVDFGARLLSIDVPWVPSGSAGPRQVPRRSVVPVFR